MSASDDRRVGQFVTRDEGIAILSERKREDALRRSPPRPGDHRLGKLAGAHVHIVVEPVNEPGLDVVVGEVEQSVDCRHTELAQLVSMSAVGTQ